MEKRHILNELEIRRRMLGLAYIIMCRRLTPLDIPPYIICQEICSRLEKAATLKYLPEETVFFVYRYI